jgi:phage-related protein
MAERFSIEYVVLPSGSVPVREFLDSVDDEAAARINGFIDRLAILGTGMPAKFVKKLTGSLLELRVKHFDRIFRVLFFYQPDRVIVVTSGFQKRTEQIPWAEIKRAEALRKVWLKYRNDYPKSAAQRAQISKEHGL